MIGTVARTPSPSYTDATELEKGGVHYSYAVSAVDGAGTESRRSTPVDVVRPWHAAPVDVRATLADRTLYVDWTQPSVGNRPDHYVIYRSKTFPVSKAPEFFAETSGGEPFTLREDGNDYYYAVVGFSPAMSAFSESVKPVVIERKPGQSAAPVMWQGFNQDGGAVLTWENGNAKPDDPQIVGYNLYRWTSEDRPEDRTGAIKLNSGLLTTREYKDSSVRDGVHYWYAATAVTEDGTESEPAHPTSYFTAN